MAELTYEHLPPYGLMFKDYQDGASMAAPPGDWLRKSWAKTLLRYCPWLASEVSFIDETVLAGVQHKAGEIDLLLKAAFQRPRPYQTCMILGSAFSSRFDYRHAKTAITPALISGHGFQAIVAGCNVYAVLSRHDEELAKKSRVGIQRWMTDIGDRRVLAGVYYPADGMASWIAALRLAPEVFEAGPVIQSFLAEAIKGSTLYRFLDGRIAGSALERPWACVEGELSRPT